MANLRDQEARNRIWGEQRDVVINIDSGDDEDGGCCPECGAELPDCPTCHQSMPMCPQCGAQVDETGPTRPGVVGMATRAAGKGGQFAKGGGHVPGAGGKPGRSGLAVAAGTPSSQWSPSTVKGLQAHQAGGASSKAGAASPVSGLKGAAARLAGKKAPAQSLLSVGDLRQFKHQPASDLKKGDLIAIKTGNGEHHAAAVHSVHVDRVTKGVSADVSLVGQAGASRTVSFGVGGTARTVKGSRT